MVGEYGPSMSIFNRVFYAIKDNFNNLDDILFVVCKRCEFG